MQAQIDDPIMKGFVDQLDYINAVADRSEGFVWRLQTEDGDATAIRARIFRPQCLSVRLPGM